MLFAAFIGGIVLWIIGSALEKKQRAKAERELDREIELELAKFSAWRTR
jgi:hypothetical protein